MNTIRTFSGRLVDPLDLKPSDIRADDICWALSQICRYGGHCHRDYTVGEHTLAVADSVWHDKTLRLPALLHDASEVYLGDMVTPLKHRMPAFVVCELKAHAVIAKAFGLSPTDFIREIEHGAVKNADVLAGNNERKVLWEHVNTIARGTQREYVAARLFARLKETTDVHYHKSLGLDKPHIFC